MKIEATMEAIQMNFGRVLLAVLLGVSFAALFFELGYLMPHKPSGQEKSRSSVPGSFSLVGPIDVTGAVFPKKPGKPETTYSWPCTSGTANCTLNIQVQLADTMPSAVSCSTPSQGCLTFRSAGTVKFVAAGANPDGTTCSYTDYAQGEIQMLPPAQP